MAILNLNLTSKQKGLLYMVLGIVILLYAFNFFQKWLTTFVVIAGFALVFYGFVKIGGVETVKALLSRSKKHK